MNQRPLILVLLCLSFAGGARAEPLGRLFMTPQERAALERIRPGPSRPAPQPGSGAAPAPRTAAEAAPAAGGAAALRPEAGQAQPAPVMAALEGAQVIVVNGIVRRSGAAPLMTWVDAVPYAGPARLKDGVRLRPGQAGGQVTLVLRSGKSVTLKPGQQVDPQTGQVQEAGRPGSARQRRVPVVTDDRDE
jgi:hypothetical protein